MSKSGSGGRLTGSDRCPLSVSATQDKNDGFPTFRFRLSTLPTMQGDESVGSVFFERISHRCDPERLWRDCDPERLSSSFRETLRSVFYLSDSRDVSVPPSTRVWPSISLSLSPPSITNQVSLFRSLFLCPTLYRCPSVFLLTPSLHLSLSPCVPLTLYLCLCHCDLPAALTLYLRLLCPSTGYLQVHVPRRDGVAGTGLATGPHRGPTSSERTGTPSSPLGTGGTADGPDGKPYSGDWDPLMFWGSVFPRGRGATARRRRCASGCRPKIGPSWADPRPRLTRPGTVGAELPTPPPPGGRAVAGCDGPPGCTASRLWRTPTLPAPRQGAHLSLEREGRP